MKKQRPKTRNDRLHKILDATNSSDAGELRVFISFLCGGLLSGFVFAWFITRPALQGFWYIKGDKFLIPRYTYWTAFSFTLLLGFLLAYFVARARRWLLAKSIGSVAIVLLSFLIIGASAPTLYFLTPLMNRGIGFTWDFLVAPIAFVALLSLSFCVLTRSLRLIALAFVWNVVFLVGGLILVYAAVHLVNSTNAWYEFVQWPILESMLALSFGNWIIWRERISSQRDRVDTHDITIRSCL